MWIGKRQWQELWNHILTTNKEMGQVQQDTTKLKVDVGKIKISVGWLKWLVGALVLGLIGFAYAILTSVLP